jgi:hypothetical protein
MRLRVHTKGSLFAGGGGNRIAPTEYGWGKNENESRPLGNDLISAKLKVTAKNVGQDVKRIRILNTLQNQGRIVEFA